MGKKEERKKQFVQIDKCLSKSLLPVGSLLADILSFSPVFNFSLEGISVYFNFCFRQGGWLCIFRVNANVSQILASAFFFATGKVKVVPLHFRSGCMKARVIHTWRNDRFLACPKLNSFSPQPSPVLSTYLFWWGLTFALYMKREIIHKYRFPKPC